MAARNKDSKAHSAPSGHDTESFIAGVAAYARIAHQVSGRVRIKLESSPQDASIAGGAVESLRRRLETLPCVRGVSLNLLARSCVVEYDNAVIPDAAWADLLAGRPTPAAKTLLGLLADISPDSHVSR